MTLRAVLATMSAGLMLLLTGAVAAQDRYPSRPITIVVGFAAGGAGDVAARWVGEYVRSRWNVPFVIENRPGAGATIAAGQIARAKPDGYTLTLATSSPYTVAPYFQPVTYDPANDFTYLFQFLVSPQSLVVRADNPARNVEDFIAWAKANPGTLNWSTAAPNGLPHIATEAAFRHLGIKGQYVPYKGGAEALFALLSGQLHAAVVADFYNLAGKVRLLAETGPDKLEEFPQVPTFRELGMPISAQVFYGIAGPAGLPPPVVSAWNDLSREMVATAGFKEMVSKLKSQPSYLQSDAFTQSVVGVYRSMGKLIPELGLKN